MSVEGPTFSIVIPVYNRADLVERTIESCLIQTFPSLEVIAVDDASTDQSVEVMRAMSDPRLHVYQEAVNKNMGPTRNIGARYAKGDWILFLDSDDELAPNCLENLHRAIEGCQVQVDGVIFPNLMDDGQIFPTEPLPSGEVWDFERYLQFLEQAHKGNNSARFLIRRSTTQGLEFPSDKPYTKLAEMHYWLDFMSTRTVVVLNDPLYIYHLHPENDTAAQSKPGRGIAEAESRILRLRAMLGAFGTPLHASYPSGFKELTQNAAVAGFLSGRRALGMKSALYHLKRYPFDLKMWIIMLAGLCGPKTLESVRQRSYRQ